jgi:hypothetical protein
MNVKVGLLQENVEVFRRLINKNKKKFSLGSIKNQDIIELCALC